MCSNKLKGICNGVHFFDKTAGWGPATLPKNAPLQVFSIIFAQICSVLQRVSQNFTHFCFPENLLIVAADYGLRKPKILCVSYGNLIVLKWQNIHVFSNLKYTVIKTKNWRSSLLFIQQRRIQNPLECLSKEVTSLEVTIFAKCPS